MITSWPLPIEFSTENIKERMGGNQWLVFENRWMLLAWKSSWFILILLWTVVLIFWCILILSKGHDIQTPNYTSFRQCNSNKCNQFKQHPPKCHESGVKLFLTQMQMEFFSLGKTPLWHCLSSQHVPTWYAKWKKKDIAFAPPPPPPNRLAALLASWCISG